MSTVIVSIICKKYVHVGTLVSSFFALVGYQSSAKDLLERLGERQS